MKLKAALRSRAEALGFDAIGFAGAASDPQTVQRFQNWLAAGHHADMAWMADRPERRVTPQGLWPEVKTVVLLGVNYGSTDDPLATLEIRDKATLSLYARRRDYHEIIKGRLKELAGFLVARGGGDVKVFVDTAPVLEKSLAARAGLGWQGKNTVLTSRRFGAWLFLGAIYTTLDLEADAAEPDRCGSCRRCLDICPTSAFPSPYVLDARRCLAYLSVEHKGTIPPEFRKPMGNRVFGCDDCLAVCPWNKFAAASRSARLALNPDLAAPDLAHLARLDEAAFRALFAGTPIKRTGRVRVLRNVLIAIGNSGMPELAAEAERLASDPAPLVRAMAAWALGELLPADSFRTLAARHLAQEADMDVRAEWLRPMAGASDVAASSAGSV